MKNPIISDVIKRVVTQLVAGNYTAVYEGDRSKEILPDELEAAIYGYSGELTLPPDESFSLFTDYGSVDSTENQIEFTLWYDNEPSDLTLSMTIFEPDRYEINDIRVL